MDSTSATTKITVIGAGHMGEALLHGLVKQGFNKHNLVATDPDAEKLAQLKMRLSIQVTTDNRAGIEHAHIVIFAIQPKIFASVAAPIAKSIALHQTLVISVAAGIREKTIQQILGEERAIVRAMPNSAALIGCSATALYANRFVSPLARKTAEEVMGAIGSVVWVTEEKWLDIVTALSGSGPAYFFLLMEALEQAAVTQGLPEEIATLLTTQTALGAARLCKESGVSASTLRERVTSPGGTTEKAIAVLEKHHVRDIFSEALQAARLRAEEIAQELGGV